MEQINKRSLFNSTGCLRQFNGFYLSHSQKPFHFLNPKWINKYSFPDKQERIKKETYAHIGAFSPPPPLSFSRKGEHSIYITAFVLALHLSLPVRVPEGGLRPEARPQTKLTVNLLYKERVPSCFLVWTYVTMHCTYSVFIHSFVSGGKENKIIYTQ